MSLSRDQISHLLWLSWELRKKHQTQTNSGIVIEYGNQTNYGDEHLTDNYSDKIPDLNITHFEFGVMVINGIQFEPFKEDFRVDFHYLTDAVFEVLHLWDAADIGCEMSDKLFFTLANKKIMWAVKKDSGIIRNSLEYNATYQYAIGPEIYNCIRKYNLINIFATDKHICFTASDRCITIKIPILSLAHNVTIGFKETGANAVWFDVNKQNITTMLLRSKCDNFKFNLKTGTLLAISDFGRVQEQLQLKKVDHYEDFEQGFEISICRSMLAYLTAVFNQWKFQFTTKEFAVILNRSVLLRS